MYCNRNGNYFCFLGISDTKNIMSMFLPVLFKCLWNPVTPPWNIFCWSASCDVNGSWELVSCCWKSNTDNPRLFKSETRVDCKIHCEMDWSLQAGFILISNYFKRCGLLTNHLNNQQGQWQRLARNGFITVVSIVDFKISFRYCWIPHQFQIFMMQKFTI